MSAQTTVERQEETIRRREARACEGCGPTKPGGTMFHGESDSISYHEPSDSFLCDMCRAEWSMHNGGGTAVAADETIRQQDGQDRVEIARPEPT